MISEADARKAAGVVAGLVSRLEFVTDWRLQKGYYLAEVWSIEERLRRLSKVDFAAWSHGPWSLHVREATELLEAEGVLAKATQPARRRPEAEFLKITSTKGLPSIGGEDEEFLGEVAAQIKYLDGDTLTRIAKSTPPYMSAKARQLVDLDGYLESLIKKHAALAESAKVAALVAEARAE